MSILRHIADLIWPPLCHVCDCRLPEGETFLCPPCIEALPRTGYHRYSPELNPMELRFAGIIPFERATGYFFYSPGSALASLIHDFKYRQFPGLARQLGKIMADELYSTGFFSGADYIIPVPLHFMKQCRRGYNQSGHIALGVSEATGISINTDLRARRPHRTQTALTHEQRAENIRGIFRLRNADRLRGKTVVIIDDVCTTGATLTEAAATILREAPGSRVLLLTLGVTF